MVKYFSDKYPELNNQGGYNTEEELIAAEEKIEFEKAEKQKAIEEAKAERAALAKERKEAAAEIEDLIKERIKYDEENDKLVREKLKAFNKKFGLFHMSVKGSEYPKSIFGIFDNFFDGFFNL